MSHGNTPVVILFFNRPLELKRLIARLAEVKPTRLYLVSDGARVSREGEWEKVEACRGLFNALTWNCEIRRNYSNVNFGCRQRIVSGLDWVFEQEERAIILEDDCIPTLDFFPFVETVLEQYKDVPEVLSVGGTNLRPQLSDPDYDVVFTKYAMIWGWATWRRAWRLMDKGLDSLAYARETHQLRKWLGSWRAEWYWLYLLRHVPSSWGYRWAFTGFMHTGLHVLPSKCLVENVGMRATNATHTFSHQYDLPSVEESWGFRNRIPPCCVPNRHLDKWIEDNIFSKSIYCRSVWLFRKILSGVSRFFRGGR